MTCKQKVVQTSSNDCITAQTEMFGTLLHIVLLITQMTSGSIFTVLHIRWEVMYARNMHTACFVSLVVQGIKSPQKSSSTEKEIRPITPFLTCLVRPAEWEPSDWNIHLLSPACAEETGPSAPQLPVDAYEAHRAHWEPPSLNLQRQNMGSDPC